jgi:hypothetical protein
MIYLHVSNAKRERGGTMKNILTPKKRIGRKTAIVFKVGLAVWCFSLAPSTNYRDFSAIVYSGAPKKLCLFRHTSKTQGIGVGDRSRKMVLSRSLGAWSRFAHHWATVHKYSSFVHGSNSSQAKSKTPTMMSECISSL